MSCSWLVSWMAISLLATTTGCVRVAPQHVDLTALRQTLSRVNAQPKVLKALPDNWLDDSGFARYNCHRRDISKIFDKSYERKTYGKAKSFIQVTVLIYCSEELAFQDLEIHCGKGFSYSPEEAIEITFDELGAVCVSSVVQLRNDPEGLYLPSNTSSSFVGLQNGILQVGIAETHRFKMTVAKQMAIDDITARLTRVLGQLERQLPAR